MELPNTTLIQHYSLSHHAYWQQSGMDLARLAAPCFINYTMRRLRQVQPHCWVQLLQYLHPAPQLWSTRREQKKKRGKEIGIPGAVCDLQLLELHWQV